MNKATMPNFDALTIIGSMDVASVTRLGVSDTDHLHGTHLYGYAPESKDWDAFDINTNTSQQTTIPTTHSVLHRGVDPSGGQLNAPAIAFAFGSRTDPGLGSKGDYRPLICWLGASESVATSARLDTGANQWFYGGPAAPRDNADLAVHLDRLWVIGGEFDQSDRGGYGIRWSDPGGIHTSFPEDHSDWKDDVSGLYNVIDLPANGDPPRAFGKAADSLLIFTARSTWMLSGRTISSILLRPLLQGVGCRRPETVVNLNNACYFLSDDGFMRFDGYSVQDVSLPVRTELLTAIAASGIMESDT